MTSLLWFKRDLRLTDHPALAAAMQHGPVLPLYIVEPEYWQGADTSARQWAFTAESLADLQAALGALGQPLVVRTGEAVAILRELCARHGIRRMFSHEETGNLWTYARDRRVGAWAARRERFVSAGLLPGPAALTPLPGIEPGRIPTAAELGLVPDVCPGRQQGGRRTWSRANDAQLGLDF